MEKRTQKVPDEQLAQQAQAGDKEAMEILFFRYGGVIRSKARGFFLAGGETEDLVQEGMMGLYEAVSDYRKSENSLSFKNFAHL
ncbi:MAG: helix-turn-helix domain-containing protein, partial [Clostridia bacterium]|nr:helix-turn-helix domain-containing protein [Clostridia bacterium]